MLPKNICAIKGIGSGDEYFFQAYNNKYALSVHALLIEQFFVVDEKIKLKVVLACSFEITY
jgi:hypothetical protein